jgi:KH domain
VKSGDGIVVQVPKRLHHRVSNDGRSKNQLRQRFQVYVSHDGAEIPPATKPPVNGTLGRIDDEEETYSWYVVEDPSSSSDETIPWKLRGSNDNVHKAKEFIESLISSMEDQGNCTGYLGVPPEHHHLVIGKGGQKIGIVRDETGCTVDVPRRGDGSDTIVIRGTKEGVERAKEMIVESVEAGNHRSNGSSRR